MRFFVCLIDPEGHSCSLASRQAYELVARLHQLDVSWHELGGLLVLTAEDPEQPSGWSPMVVADHNEVAVGMARLDNREEAARWAGCQADGVSDLELVLRLIQVCGAKRIPDLLGDFAFLVWNSPTRTGIAACDTFAVRKLYYTVGARAVAFSSRAEVLALREEYDPRFLAEVICYCPPADGHTPYFGVQAVPAAGMVQIDGGNVVVHRYWSAEQVQPETAGARTERDAVGICRELVVEAVRARIGLDPNVWAQLSGGLDSSSVVCTAQWLAAAQRIPHSVAGTVTYCDSHGTGADERRFSDAVVERFHLRNETIIDSLIWQDDDLGPPRLDYPSAIYPYYARDRRLCQLVLAAGGGSLLTGQGGDELFTGNMFFFADAFARGDVWQALREMARRAALGRVSFWELAYRNAFLPLLPGALQRHLIRESGLIPSWITPRTIGEFELTSASLTFHSYAGRWGHKYGDAVQATIDAIPSKLVAGVVEDALDVRHPYLHRPLVEFALSLPSQFCVRPHARKWILREAMRDILPEQVRTRIGKGVMNGALSWSLANQTADLEPLLHDPILAQLGLIDPAKLRGAFQAAQNEREGSDVLSPDVQYTLAVEAWLQARSGRWAGGLTAVPEPYQIPN